MLTTSVIPARLQQIPQPPENLFIMGEKLENLLMHPCIAVVGSRKVSAYGKVITHKLVSELARAGVVIISGLALGTDGIAHRAVLEAGGRTIAVLPTSLAHIYPSTHAQLAKQIIGQGGALVTEYAADYLPQKWNFVQRNRLVSGLSDAVLIPEAGLKSGTLHTAEFAIDQGREVLAVPGNITSPTSAGTNNLIKGGATPVTSVDDVLHALGIAPTTRKRRPMGDTPEQQLVLDLLYAGTSDGAELLLRSKLTVTAYNQTVTMLEITGKVRALGANHWALL
jgi:DNA processing protein